MFLIMILIFTYPLIGALVAFLISYLSVRQFLKYQPSSKSTLSGILQKNRIELIHEIATFVEKNIDILSLLSETITDESEKMIEEDIKKYASKYIKDKIPEKFPMIMMMGGDKVILKLQEVIENEIDGSIKKNKPKLVKYAEENIEIKKLIETKLLEVDMQLLHAFISKITKRQTRNISALFVISGFLIGMVLMTISIFI